MTLRVERHVATGSVFFRLQWAYDFCSGSYGNFVMGIRIRRFSTDDSYSFINLSV